MNCRIVFFLLLAPFFLQGSELTIFDIARSFNQQYAVKLISAIPPELSNLPYATYPDSPQYNTLRFNFNKRFNIFPKAIIAPTTVDEVIYVFKALKKYRLDFSIRSGGHCFEPGSLSSDYVVDLNQFNEIIPNIDEQEVYVGAGCRLNNVISALGAIDYAIPTGTCPSVGVTGLTLGGGIGLLTRTYGLTCDSVKSIKLLTAHAKVIEVTKHSHPDLFWALRGGGNGSYGIVLGFTFKMHYLPVVSFFDLAWTWEPQQAVQIINAWQKWVIGLPDSISTSLRLSYKEGLLEIKVIGIKAGNKPFTEWKKAFKKLDPTVTIYQDTYLNTVQYWSAEPSLPFNKIKSKILLKPLSQEVVVQIVDYMEYLKRKNPNLRVFLNFDGFGGRVPDFHNSFAFRKAFGWWYQAIYWPLQTQDAQALSLIDRIYYTTSPNVSPYSYANATDYALGKDYLHAYYRQYVDRLIEVKRKYDPKNIFQWQQSIPVKWNKHESCQ